ncbi:MAG: hypothetical protein IT207_05880 [Fimbriimonadaceae bacterium]|nr:hypothetical protein [Fimbriimonadaceae bacterium]
MGSLRRNLADGWNGKWGAWSYLAILTLTLAVTAVAPGVRRLAVGSLAEGCTSDPPKDYATQIRARLAQGQ